MEKKRGTRRCVHCPNFHSDARTKHFPECIGVCGLYRKLVKDTLCGCKTDRDGIVTLLNFGGDSPKKQ